MKTTEQKVESYSDMFHAKNRMNENINSGWMVHICSTFVNGGVLVVYEKELEAWN